MNIENDSVDLGMQEAILRHILLTLWKCLHVVYQRGSCGVHLGSNVECISCYKDIFLHVRCDVCKLNTTHQAHM